MSPPELPSLSQAIATFRQRWPDVTGDDSVEPVFVLSAGWRSGSTFLQRMLMPECFVWGEVYGHANPVESLAEPIRRITATWPPPNYFHDGRPPAELTCEFVANLYPPPDRLPAAHAAWFRALLEEPARRAGSERWGLKEVRIDVEQAVYLKWVFPRARFLFLVRNPYDALRSYLARSNAGMRWFSRWPDVPLDAREFGRHWRRLAGGFVERQAEVDGLLVRYEALRTGEARPAIEKYLGFPLSDEASRSNPGDGGPPPLHRIPDDVRDAFETELGPLPRQLGYEERSHGGQPWPARLGAPGEGTVVIVLRGPGIDPLCEDGLRTLEQRGYTVRRVAGYAATDQGRNECVATALRDGFAEVIWIAPDTRFDPDDVERLRSHDLPIVAGLPPGAVGPGCEFVGSPEPGEPSPARWVDFGLVVTRRDLYRRLHDALDLPLCNERFGPGVLPFFQPTVDAGTTPPTYLPCDRAFCHRLSAAGIALHVDPAVRLRRVTRVETEPPPLADGS